MNTETGVHENGQYLMKTNYVVEVERVEKPAMIAEWLFLLVYAD